MRLIDADAIKAEIQKICDNCWHPYRLGGCPEHCGINDAVKDIDSAPTVDAIEVVRCRDCKYNSNPPECGNAVCVLFYGMTDQMGFCHHGERREQDETD